jgi:molybdopterin-containing oxidoreductase family membrane subunit
MSARGGAEQLLPGPAPTTKTPTFADVNRDVIRTLEAPGNLYFGWMSFIALMLAGGIFAWTMQIYYGMGMAGKRNPQMWAMYITTFVFWIGIGHAGTLISAVLYRARWGRRSTAGPRP